MYEIKIEAGDALGTLGRIERGTHDLTPLARSISVELLSQAEANFAAEGRPPWLGLSRATLEKRVMRVASKGRRRKDGRVSKAVGGRVSGMILQDSGQLAASITTGYDATSATIGSNKVYAAIHQLGGQTGRGHKTTIHARPYLPVDAQGNLQPQAEQGILGIANTYLASLIRG